MPLNGLNIELPQGNGIRKVKVFNGKKQGSHHEQPPSENILGQMSSIFMVQKCKKNMSRGKKRRGHLYDKKTFKRKHSIKFDANV